MKNIVSLAFVVFVLTVTFFGCDKTQIKKRLDEAGFQLQLSDQQIAEGLKEALIKGIEEGANLASKADGYFKNPKIKLEFPEDIASVESTIRDMGLGGVVDKFIKTLNTSAEFAANEAKPIFVNAIKSLTIQDARNILKGEKDAASQYLKANTYQELSAQFKSVIQDALQKTNTTKYYNTIVSTYNKIPLIADVNPNLDDYATEKAIDGLFTLIAQEEAKIRENPLERTSDLLKSVFGLVD